MAFGVPYIEILILYTLEIPELCVMLQNLIGDKLANLHYSTVLLFNCTAITLQCYFNT